MERKEEMCSMRTPSDRYNEKKGSEWMSEWESTDQNKVKGLTHYNEQFISFSLSLSPSLQLKQRFSFLLSLFLMINCYRLCPAPAVVASFTPSYLFLASTSTWHAEDRPLPCSLSLSLPLSHTCVIHHTNIRFIVSYCVSRVLWVVSHLIHKHSSSLQDNSMAARKSRESELKAKVQRDRE